MSKPQYIHDCDACTFLGVYGRTDLYHCLQGGNFPTLIVREGDEGWNYQSGIVFAELGLTAFVEAKARAEALHLTLSPGDFSMIFTYVTASGSRHVVDRERRLYWREPGLEGGYSLPMRKDFTKISYVEANSPEPGEDLIVVLVGVADSAVTVRRTSPVVTIEATSPKV